jgi:hypothetical protein
MVIVKVAPSKPSTTISPLAAVGFATAGAAAFFGGIVFGLPLPGKGIDKMRRARKLQKEES